MRDIIIAQVLTPSEMRAIIKSDLVGKYQREDWHGVMDCAADLREHDAYYRGLEQRCRTQRPD
jgi:hypothetical protein